MHKSDMAEKNEFLQDLDKNDVSLSVCSLAKKMMCIYDSIGSSCNYIEVLWTID